MIDTRARAEALLTELYSAGNDFLNQYPWEYEGDRWAELLVCSLVVELGVPSSTAREAIGTLNTLGLTGTSGLANASPDECEFIQRVFIQHGLEPELATRATVTLVSIARVTQRLWQGHLQRLLRDHGKRMAAELGAALREAGVSAAAAPRIAVLWLQSVANIPLLLPGDPHIKDFCKEHRLTQRQLVASADRLGLNVAVLDDLLALEALAAADADSSNTTSEN